VIERLEVFIVILGPLEEQEVKLMRAIQEAAQEQKIPRGVGPLTFEILRREVGDWSRFNNRRQVFELHGKDGRMERSKVFVIEGIGVASTKLCTLASPQVDSDVYRIGGS
jgi:hypothetical protein